MNQVEALKKIVDIFNTGDVSEADDIFSENYIDHQRPYWLTEDGPEEFKKIVTSARKSLTDLTVKVNDFTIDGDKITARLHWMSKDVGGNKIERETEDILQFKDGKVIEHWGVELWNSRNKKFRHILTESAKTYGG